jgi:uridine phosphorylase
MDMNSDMSMNRVHTMDSWMRLPLLMMHMVSHMTCMTVTWMTGMTAAAVIVVVAFAAAADSLLPVG